MNNARLADLLIAALLWLCADLLRAARDAQSSADPRGSDRLSKRGGWWNYATGWQRKYRAWPTDRRPAWAGSLTWSVAASDFWHFAQWASSLLQAAALALAGGSWHWLLVTLPARLAFEYAYRRLR